MFVPNDFWNRSVDEAMEKLNGQVYNLPLARRALETSTFSVGSSGIDEDALFSVDRHLTNGNECNGWASASWKQVIVGFNRLYDSREVQTFEIWYNVTVIS